MKFYLKPILSVLALAVLLAYSGCGGKNNPGPSVEEVQLGKLSAAWKVGSTGDVTLDAVSKKTDYQNFTLTLTGSAGATTYNFVKTGGPALTPFPTSGSWKFGTNPETDILIGDGDKQLNATYSVTDSQLQITFNYQGAGEASRTGEVKGTWVFTLVKQ